MKVDEGARRKCSLSSAKIATRGFCMVLQLDFVHGMRMVEPRMSTISHETDNRIGFGKCLT